MAPPVSAQKPCIGVRRVIFEPMVWTMRQPPNSVPSAIAAWQVSTTQNGTWNSPPEMALREEQHGDDAHGLLRVVAAMAERVERGRDELQMRKRAVDRERRACARKPGDGQHQQQAPGRSRAAGESTIAGDRLRAARSRRWR